MRSLFPFLWKHHFTVLFILLEGIALSLLFNSYSYHRSLAFNTVNDFTGSIYKLTNNVSDYFSLKRENKVLLDENKRLYDRLYVTNRDADSIRNREDSLFTFIHARVISNSVDNRDNFILIDKGSIDGIEPEMGIISPHGLAGIVIGVSEHYAYVMSMLHKNTRISARIKKNNQLVSVIWKGLNYRYGTVIDIPSHIELSPGDTIVTSGFSLIFPDGIDIGTVTEQEKTAEKGLSVARIAFSTDFNNLTYVYAIRNKNKKEQEQLLNDFADD